MSLINPAMLHNAPIDVIATPPKQALLPTFVTLSNSTRSFALLGRGANSSSLYCVREDMVDDEMGEKREEKIERRERKKRV